MNLRRQLLLVSLLTLILPWAGCQFIRETESALREGQQQMLSGMAQAVADSMSQFHYELLSDDEGSDRLYAHPLQVAPLVDGYIDDWTVPDDAMASMRGRDGPIRYVAGIHRQHWFVFVDVPDPAVVYRGNGRYYDEVELISVDEQNQLRRFRFSAEAPGEIVALTEDGGVLRNETRAAAVWRDYVDRLPDGNTNTAQPGGTAAWAAGQEFARARRARHRQHDLCRPGRRALS